MAARQELITRFSGDARPLTQTASQVKKIVSGMVVGAAGYGGYKMFVSAVQSAMDFEKQMSLVRGMLDGISDADFETLKGKIRAVVRELGATHEAGAEVAYMLASNAIAAKDIDTYTRAILGLSKALNADAGAVGQTLLRGMAAWGMGADQVEHVTDVLAGMAKVGNMTGADMAQYFSTFSSLAAGMQVDMEEAGAAFAIATREAKPDQAAAGMRMLLSTLSRNNSALQEFGASGRIATKGLIAGVAELVKLAEGNPDLLNQMFPEQNAKMMALIIANQQREMSAAMARLRSDTQLYESMLGPVMDSAQVKFDKLKAKLVDVGIQFGDQILEPLGEIVDDLGEMAVDPAFVESVIEIAKAFAWIVKSVAWLMEEGRGQYNWMFGTLTGIDAKHREIMGEGSGNSGTGAKGGMVRKLFSATNNGSFLADYFRPEPKTSFSGDTAILKQIAANTAPREAQ